MALPTPFTLLYKKGFYMKKGDKFIILLLLLVVLLIAAAIGYRFLSERYTPEEIPFTVVADEDVSLPESNSGNTNSKNNSSADNDSVSSENMKVPDFTVYTPEGNAISLYGSLGKPVVLNFWATWCGPCQSEMPAFDRMHQQYGDEVTFLMVNVTDGSRDTVESVTTFYKDSGYTFPIYFDTSLEASMTYGAYSIPVTFFIDSEGNLLYNHMGAISEDALAQCMELLVKSANNSETE